MSDAHICEYKIKDIATYIWALYLKFQEACQVKQREAEEDLLERMYMIEYYNHNFLIIIHTYNCDCTNIFYASGRNAAKAVCSSDNLDIIFKETKCNTSVFHFLQLLELDKTK